MDGMCVGPTAIVDRAGTVCVRVVTERTRIQVGERAMRLPGPLSTLVPRTPNGRPQLIGKPYGETVSDRPVPSPFAARGIAPGAELVTVGGIEVEVRRSHRRRKTVSAYRQDGRVVVMVPARCSKAEERRWVETMVARLQAPRRRRRSDSDLEDRARELSRRYFSGRASPSSVSWSDAQGRRWGSCTLATGAIRLSSRLRDFPPYVVDYVLVHELAHLLVADHSAEFWELVSRYPQADRARGFLDGVTYGQRAPNGAAEPASEMQEGEAAADIGRG